MENIYILDFFVHVRLSKEESLHDLGLRSLLYVFQLQHLVTPSWIIFFFPERCVYLLNGPNTTLTLAGLLQSWSEMLKDESMAEAVTHPVQATSVATFSLSVTHTGVQKRDKRIWSEKEINRSESIQSWSGVGQFNIFTSVRVSMWDVQHGLWYVAACWMYVSRWWAGTCWVLDGLFINHEACGLSLSSPLQV